jgi:hypothetical protein
MVVPPIKPISRFLVLGCGHSGTTLIGGLLHINGYRSFRVSRLYENVALNELNQRILDGHHVPDHSIRAFISAVEEKTHGKWALKDPRLSETIERFYPHFREPLKIIIHYRRPDATVRSLLRDLELFESTLSSAEMHERAEEEWLRRNHAILKFVDSHNRDPVLFTNYDDLVDRKLDEALCRFVGHRLDLSFIQPKKRHETSLTVRNELYDLYDELNRRFSANQDEISRTLPHVSTSKSDRVTLRTRYHQAIRAVGWRLEAQRKRWPVSAGAKWEKSLG